MGAGTRKRRNGGADHFALDTINSMLLGSIATADTAALRGYGVIVGETSLLSRAALTVAHRRRESLLGQEKAFGLHLLQHDIVPDSLTFGVGGRLAADAVPCGSGSGFGRVTVPTAHAVSPAAPSSRHLPARD